MHPALSTTTAVIGSIRRAFHEFVKVTNTFRPVNNGINVQEKCACIHARAGYILLDTTLRYVARRCHVPNTNGHRLRGRAKSVLRVAEIVALIAITYFVDD